MTENALRSEHEDLQKKYKLVSDLLAAKPNEHVAFKKFEALLNGEFRAFADAESSLDEEAKAVDRLEKLAERLKELVAFPHLFAKRSIAIGGGFSSGKSAFVNSFIEGYKRLLPEQVQPATAIPSFVMANSEMAIKGFSRTGDTVDIDPVLYSELSHNFIDTFPFNLKDIMPSITVEVPLRDDLFTNICLIDTPGYNPGGRREDRTTAAEFLKDRDALVWMIGLDSTGTVPEDDLDFLEELEVGSLPLYVVLNKADVRPRGELADILDEVKDALAEADIEPVGISVYSSRRREEFLYDGMPLAEFFREQNQPKEANADLKQEIESVFEMYENAIVKDERTAKWMTKELKAIDFHISGLSADDADVLNEKISKLIESQERDFAPIKKQMGEIRQKMLGAVDEIFRSLNLNPKPTRREAAEKREANKFFAAERRKPSPKMVDDEGATDLHHAVRLNLPVLAQFLLDQGDNINAQAEYGYTPLHDAAAANAGEAAKVLIQNGADINAQAEDGDTPLHQAVWANAGEVAKVLLQNGASIDAQTKEGITLLHEAAWANAGEAVKVLIQHGADINAQADKDRTPLHYAAQKNAGEATKVLLQNGAFMNARTKDGITPLHYAAQENAGEATKVLLQNGAFMNARTEDGDTPLHYAAQENAGEVAKVLIQNGAKVNAEDKYDSSPLHVAAKKNAYEAAEVLLENRAKVNAQDAAGRWSRPPIHYAKGKTKKLLRRYGGKCTCRKCR